MGIRGGKWERPAVRALNRSFMAAAAQPGAVALTAAAGMVGGPTDIAIAAVAATGGMVGGLLPDFFAAVTERVTGSRARGAGAALSAATDSAGVSGEELADRVAEDPFIARLTYETLQGAADATYDEKISALADILAHGLGAPGVEEQRRLLAQSTVVRDIEEVHALVLWTLSTPAPSAGVDAVGEWQGWTLATLQGHLRLGALLTPVIQRLQAQGLVHDMVRSDGERSYFALSTWGEEILALLTAAHEEPETAE